jgi:hypothetical protein
MLYNPRIGLIGLLPNCAIVAFRVILKAFLCKSYANEKGATFLNERNPLKINVGAHGFEPRTLCL